MTTDPTIHLTGFIVLVTVLGISAHWLAWRFRLPAILLFSLFYILSAYITRGIMLPWFGAKVRKPQGSQVPEVSLGGGFMGGSGGISGGGFMGGSGGTLGGFLGVFFGCFCMFIIIIQ